jgi:AcrR family transcriptional regulator
MPPRRTTLRRPSPRPPASPPSLAERARGVAVKHFARFGFEGASLSEIADEVGTSKQALIYHFKSKEGLREAVIEDTVRRWNETLPRLVTALTRERVPFEEALSEVFVFLLAEPDYARFFVQEKLRRATPDSIQGPLTTYWVGLATELVRRGQREKTVSASVDPEMWATSIIDVIVGAFAFADPKMSAQRRARQLKEVARIVGSSLRDGT